LAFYSYKPKLDKSQDFILKYLNIINVYYIKILKYNGCILYQNIKIPANGRPMGSMKDIMQIVHVTEGLHLDVLGKFHICRDTTSGSQINDKHTVGSSVTFDVTTAHCAHLQPSVLPQHCSERCPLLCRRSQQFVHLPYQDTFNILFYVSTNVFLNLLHDNFSHIPNIST
jgi:hypothetical protein